MVLTSSRSEGRIFLVCRPSENRFRTPVKPFMNEIFSSLVFAVKLERSRKLSVDIGREEKKGCEGSVDGVGRSSPRRVISDRMRAEEVSKRAKRQWVDERTLQIRLPSLHPGYWFASVIAQSAQTPMALVRSCALGMYSIQDASEGIHVRCSEELLIQSILWG